MSGTPSTEGTAGPRSSIQPGSTWAWLLACIPFLQALAMEPFLIGFMMVAGSPTGTASGGTIDLLVIGFGVDWFVTLLAIGVGGLLSFLDARLLRRRGVSRPFAWGWGFVLGVYLVGRTVVLQRRIGRGGAPLVLGASLFVVAMVVVIVQFLVVFAAALHTAPAFG